MSGRLVLGNGLSFNIDRVRFEDASIILMGTTLAPRDYDESDPWQGLTLYGDDDTIIAIWPDDRGAVPAGTEQGDLIDFSFKVMLDKELGLGQ